MACTSLVICGVLEGPGGAVIGVLVVSTTTCPSVPARTEGVVTGAPTLGTVVLML